MENMEQDKNRAEQLKKLLCPFYCTSGKKKQHDQQDKRENKTDAHTDLDVISDALCDPSDDTGANAAA